MENLVQFVYLLFALLVTLSVHEAAHALVAYYLGDPTAKLNGRLTLNPIKHLDPLGSIVFLITRTIGWGKPVPVNPNNFKNPIRDNALTALAGPMSNFVLAFAVALPWKYLGGYMPDWITLFFTMIFHVSIFLGIFNFFPIPPLDGSKILGLIIPKRIFAKYEEFMEKAAKYFIAIILIDAFILSDFVGFSVFGSAMRYLHDLVATVLLLGT
ncbi:MAG: site-2 protease family protein [Candidatus Gracilibacteria bacterium]|nr:site-2 protease family protein [Candidatus Gracilibacteria bacterium]